MEYNIMPYKRMVFSGHVTKRDRSFVLLPCDELHVNLIKNYLKKDTTTPIVVSETKFTIKDIIVYGECKLTDRNKQLIREHIGCQNGRWIPTKDNKLTQTHDAVVYFTYCLDKINNPNNIVLLEVDSNNVKKYIIPNGN